MLGDALRMKDTARRQEVVGEPGLRAVELMRKPVVIEPSGPIANVVERTAEPTSARRYALSR